MRQCRTCGWFFFPSEKYRDKCGRCSEGKAVWDPEPLVLMENDPSWWWA